MKIEKLMELAANGSWTGTTSELLAALGTPGSPEGWSKELSRRQSELESLGIRLTRKRQAGTGRRLWIIGRDGSAATVTGQGTNDQDDGQRDAVSLDWKPCDRYRNGWCALRWPQMAIYVRPLNECPCVNPKPASNRR